MRGMTYDPASGPAEHDRLALEFARIASEAGVAVMEVYESDFEHRTKADSSPVSDADERAEEIILARLAALLPGVAVLAEEMASRDGVGGALGDAFILVDPVDGTKEFLKRNGSFTVNIALIRNGLPVAGCVYAPARKEMFWAGAKARSLSLAAGASIATGAGEPMATRPYPTDGLTAVTSSSHLDDQTKAFMKRLPIAGETATGSSLKFCLVAQGAADVYPRFGPTMEWDTAAGHAVLLGAGGQMLSPDGSPFTYGKAAAGYLNGPFVAWGREAL
jgi:3'(2'), 5'-bisphosphate nucleotidase